MSNNLMTIANVRGFIDENGVAQLNMEDIARGFGFTTVAKSGNAVVRWARVNQYLKEFGFPQHLGENDFIPENMVYRLGFKASNDTANAFQIKLADEILPTIRKTGSYHAQPVSSLQALQMTVDELVKQDKRLSKVEVKLDKAVDDIHINEAQAFQLSELVKSRVSYFSKITGKTYRKLIGQAWREVNASCGATKYRNIRSVDFDKALQKAEEWKVS